MPKLSITVKTDGFRRAGRPWSGTEIINTDDYTKEQLQSLADDPLFDIDYAADDGANNNEQDPIINKLVEAISKLDPSNPKHFTVGENSKPQVPALKEIVGVKITVAQRDAAFEMFAQAVNQ